MPRTAVILFSLGGPSQESDIAPFLFNFFMDKNIIALPQPLRWMIATYISKTRSKGAARDAYKLLNFKSPLLDNTRAQAAALEKLLSNARVFVSMRYWHPLADDVARDVKNYDPDEIILLPLYPQFSTTTTKSSFEDWARAAKAAGLEKPTRKICCWPEMTGFIAASADNISKELAKAPANTRLLFSAHGLPEKTIAAGDPYQAQCEKTASAIVKKLGVPDLDWEICYQSRVGPLKWIGPSTAEALQKAAKDKKGVILYPHAFVSEHVETLVEIDIEYRHMAKELGIPYFAKAETVGTHPLFIKGLADMVHTIPSPCGGGKLPRSLTMQSFILSHYEWFRALHLISVMSWLAGLFYLPRLFVYHADADKGSELSETLKIMERRLLRIIMNPAMIAAWTFGGCMLYANTDLLHHGWMHVKLTGVVLMTGFHHALIKWRKAFLKDENKKSAKFYARVNEIPTLLMIVIVIMVIVKPF